MSLSQSRIASDLESIDGVGRDGWPDVGLQPLPVHNINPPLKQAGDIFLDPDILVNTDRRIGTDLDHYVGIAVRPVVAAGTRTEQRRVSDTARTQSRCVLPQLSDDLLPVHILIIAGKIVSVSRAENPATGLSVLLRSS